MAAKGYTTEAKIEDYILNSIDPSFSARIAEWIEGVENYIDQFTGRNFKADAEESERFYDGDDTSELLIDDAIEVTKVEVGNDAYGSSFTEIPASGSNRYFLDPANAVADKVPFRKITLASSLFGCGKQNQKVTAKWGYSENPPADIVFAATVLMAGIINQQKGGGNNVTSEKIGNYTVSYSEDSADSLSDFNRTKEILQSYQKINI